MQMSHSRVETFENCPYKYKLKYIDGLKTIPSDDPTNPLYLGTAIHEGIEKGVEAGLQSYFNSYPIIDDRHENEAIKLAHLLQKVDIPNGAVFEQKIDRPDFIGFIDCLIPTDNGLEMWDFKYSNNVNHYLESRQLHLYNHFSGLNISKMGYIFIPKTMIRQKKTEDLFQFRERLRETLNGMEVKTVEVPYDHNKVKEYFDKVEEINSCTNYEKNVTRLCDFCEFQTYCEKGDTTMLLPENTRRSIDPASRKKIWIYGAPFSGKTTLADAFPDPIFLNTDGNLNSFSAPVVEIKDTLNGRQTVMAWENFEAVIEELAKGSEYKTIVVDLLEDVYEHCRQFMYKEMGISHESDNNFKAWDMVLNRFLATIKKLVTMQYNIVFISHEDTTKDITKRTGEKITAIKPNLREKVATKISGMVDIVARVVCDDEGRTLRFKSDDVIFGGGRLKLKDTVIPLSYDALDKVYHSQNDAEYTDPKTAKNRR